MSCANPLQSTNNNTDNNNNHSNNNDSNSSNNNDMELGKIYGDSNPSLVSLPSYGPSRLIKIITGDNSYYKVIYDGIYPTFSLKRFVWQFMVHILFPLFWFQTNNIAHGFHSPSILGQIYTTISSIMFWIVIISYLLSSSASINGLITMPVILYGSHKIMIALKYATMTKVEYNRLMTCPDPKQAVTYRSQAEILSGWLYRMDGLIDYAVQAAAMRAGVVLSDPDMTFRFNHPSIEITADDRLKQAKYWERIIQLGSRTFETTLAPDKLGGIGNASDGGRWACAYRTAIGIVRTADKSTWSFVSYANTATTVANLLLSVVIPFGFLDYSDLRPVDVVFLASSTWINFLFFQPVVRFMICVVFDAMRQREILSCLAQMIRVSDNVGVDSRIVDIRTARITAKLSESLSLIKSTTCSGEVEGPSSDLPLETERENQPLDIQNAPIAMRMSLQSLPEPTDEIDEIPRLDIRYYSNVVSWTYLRNTMLLFGERFRVRLDIFVGISIFITVAFMALLLVATVIESQVYLSPHFLQLLLYTTINLLYLYAYALYSSTLNDEMDSHRNTISSHLLKCRKSRTIAVKEIKRFKKVLFETQLDKSETILAEKVLAQYQSLVDDYDEMSDCLEQSLAAVEVSNETTPFTILGMKAEGGISSTILSAILTFYVTLASQISGKIGTVLSGLSA